MKPIHIFDLAARNNAWLMQRQLLVAGNVANASTPGFKAKELRAFEDTLNEVELKLTATNPAHISPAEDPIGLAELSEPGSSEATHSGNTVSLEAEFGKAGDIRKAYSLNVAVMKSLNRMLMMSAKG